MNRTSTQNLAENLDPAVPVPAAGRAWQVGAAWVATLLLSNLPLVIARDLLGVDIPWIAPAWIGMAVLFFFATYLWPMLSPLRRYFLIMVVILLMAFGLDPFVKGLAAWQSLFAGRSEIVAVLGDRLLLLVETLIVLSVLFLMGMKRREVFLAVGDLSARSGSWSVSTQKRGIPWPVMGAGITLVLGGGFFGFMATQNPAALANFSAVLPWLPLVLLGAGLNAFIEEAMYRAAPLGTLLPAVGAGQALLLTSLWFGLGHYYGGIPSGLFGFVQSGLIGWIMGKAMLDTRGIALPWAIHFVLDTIIYLFIVAGMA